jgi:hypothetical protein
MNMNMTGAGGDGPKNAHNPTDLASIMPMKHICVRNLKYAGIKRA